MSNKLETIKKTSFSELKYWVMETKAIKLHDKISNIFDMKQEIIEKITNSMKKDDFDMSQPLVMGNIKDIGLFLIDGHQRLESAKRAGIDEVLVKEIQFSSLYEAQCYAYRRQSLRRNLSQIEILNAAALLTNKETRDGTGRSSKKLSEDLGVSESTIVKAKAVAKTITDDEKNELQNGNETINSLYNKKNKTNNNDKKSKPRVRDQNDEIKIDIIQDIIIMFFKEQELNAIKIILEKYNHILPHNDVFEYRKRLSSN